MKKSTFIAACQMLSAKGEAPEWIHLIPAGPHIKGRDGRSFNMSKPLDVVAAFKKLGQDLPIDVNHSTEIKAPNGEASPAYGWVTDVEARADGIWGKVSWNKSGKAAVENRDYRYISPVFSAVKSTKEVVDLLSVALTNQPNLRLTALNSQANASEEESMNPELLKALGLDKDATEADVIKAANTLSAAVKSAEDKIKAANSARNTPDMAKFVPRGDLELAINRADVAEKKIEEQEAAKIDAEIETAINQAIKDGKIAPASKDFYAAACKQENGIENFEKYIETAPVIVDKNARGKDGAPDKAKTGKLTDVEKEVCSRLGIDEKEYLATEI